jgi:beta-glucosidase
MTCSSTSSAFSQSVERLRAGERLELLVEELVAELTPAEKLGLLDGDLPFWDGLADMLGNGYNRTPIPMGCVERLGIPRFHGARSDLGS